MTEQITIDDSDQFYRENDCEILFERDLMDLLKIMTEKGLVQEHNHPFHSIEQNLKQSSHPRFFKLSGFLEMIETISLQIFIINFFHEPML